MRRQFVLDKQSNQLLDELAETRAGNRSLVVREAIGVYAAMEASLMPQVLEAFENRNPHRPGHIAIVRPSEKSLIDVDHAGPQETQAGEQNALSVTTAVGFRHHPGAWKPGGGGGLRYYAHAVDWS